MAKEIILSGGECCLVSDEDYALLMKFKWELNHSGYARATVGSGSILMHRMIMEPPGKAIVHHINSNRIDNRRENLQIASWSANNQSQNGTKKFPFIGVFYDKPTKKFRARIKKNGKITNLGYHLDSISAARAYDAAALKIYGPHAQTNEKYLEKLLAKLKSGK